MESNTGRLCNESPAWHHSSPLDDVSGGQPGRKAVTPGPLTWATGPTDTARLAPAVGWRGGGGEWAWDSCLRAR